MGLDWIGLDGWLSYTAVTPRASLKSDANIILTVDVNKEISSNMAMQVVSPGGKISYSSKKSGLLPNQGGRGLEG